ncbi:secreted protein [Melampsora americana]|nr:secreted protein [Melampsora americana]
MYSPLLLLIFIQNIKFVFSESSQECCLFYGVEDRTRFHSICRTKDKQMFTCIQPPYPKIKINKCVPYQDNKITNALTQDEPSPQLCDAVTRIENNDGTFHINCGILKVDANGKAALTKAYKCADIGSVTKVMNNCKPRASDTLSFDLDRYPLADVVVD